MWFPLTELLVLTGLRWGEGAGLRWPDVSERGGLVHVQRTVARGGRIEPTKTGTSWTIPLRGPLADLLRRQRALSYVGRTESWVFPNRGGGHKRASGASPVVPCTRTSATSRVQCARCASKASQLANSRPAMALRLT